MLDTILNSKEYWENRFKTDWELCSGSQQTTFFAKLACGMLPQWFVRKIREENYTICDIGCALGDAVEVLSQFLNVEVCGMDISFDAVKKATEKFPRFHFFQGDVMALPEDMSYNIIFCSNVLEHFDRPWEIFRNFTKIAKDYIIIQVPFREKVETKEHVYKFNSDNIPIKIDNYELIFLDTLDGNEEEKSFYKDEQILLIYSCHKSDKNLTYLCDLTDGIGKSDILKFLVKKEQFEALIEENKRYKEIEVDYKVVKQQLLDDETKREELEKEKKILIKEKKEACYQIETIKTELKGKEIELKAKETELKKKETELLELSEKLESLQKIILLAQNKCLSMLDARMFKLHHFLFRMYYQGIKGDKIERKKFRRWIGSKICGRGGDSDRRYNPLYGVVELLDGKGVFSEKQKGNLSIIEEQYKESLLAQYLKKQKIELSKTHKIKQREVREIEKIIENTACKKILIYPHVVYWEPIQTPQQLLRAFAKEGWLCFFCEHPNVEGAFREVEKNLFIVYERELLTALKETPVVVLLTWLGSCTFIEKIKNKQIWYHVLDKLDLFPYYDEYYLELHNEMVVKSEWVSYVAKPLLKCLEQRDNTIYLPNAVNPDEFLNIHKEIMPEDMIKIVETNHKIIGYYGYIAEWMDYDLIQYAAKERPEYEFVFIGKAIYDISSIENISNVHLLGLKEYNQLSDYAKYFDVATIPFVINEKMDCVSPIKFYEYCALGLPVITSNMKEMQSFVCDYVACINSKEEYLFYLDKFVTKEIKTKAMEQAPIIALQNTWLTRVKKMLNVFNTNLKLIINEDYKKYDIIILAVIDYDFRYQRPQHFASRFAQNGHRVFYVNANHYNENSIQKIEENLYIVNFKNDKFTAIHITDWEMQKIELKNLIDKMLNEYCIRDACVVVDYPNWIYGAEYIRKQYGFKIITDYMDDYTGFLNPAEKLVKRNCEILLKTSDLVIASSQFLYDIAKKYNNNVEIVRNGTEFLHFNKAKEKKEVNKKKVIGYYGAVAEWFDFNKVIYLANHLPEYNITIIGQVTKGEKILKECSNIELIGEIPYHELPKYLEYFDVCLIPFDTSTDLIKATNPVKFYEYLSAGKKIVSTEIPELKPFKNKYVYMTNDDQTYLEYVKLCLQEKDSLAGKEDCITFAKENDWQMRYETFEKLCKRAVPKISIIVLIYNNLKYNKICIESILNKTAYPNYELILIDNNSTDGTREYLKQLQEQQLDSVKIVFNDTNRGFAGGNNDGILNASGNYIVLLNNDTIVTRGWLTSLSKHLENEKELGMCGPVTNSIGNEAKINVSYNSIEEMECFSYQYTTEHMNEEYSDVKVLALFCTMIKKEVIEKCGLLDETYGIGMFEDDDYSEAVKKAGYRITVVEDAFIHHFEGMSFQKLEDEKFKKLYEENKQKFEKKWNKKWIAHKKRKGISWNTNIDNKINID